ncbi:MAG TPA: hypothetical protein VFY84_07820 [Jiangellales bacterium]|nr:hypothetical protein [Jiangellales bacterium]
MIDLRELMDERSAGHGVPAGRRLAEVQHKIAVQRRRRMAMGFAGTAVIVAGLVAYAAAVPGGSSARSSTFAAGSTTPSASVPAAPKPVAGRKIGPFAEYARGYRVVAFGEAPVSAKKVQFTWKVGSPNAEVFTYCPGLPDEGMSLDAELVVDGGPVGSINCNSELHQDPSGTGEGILTRAPVSVGETATVTYRLFGAQDARGRSRPAAIPTQGTVYVAVAEKVPFTQFPLPPRPATLAPPKPDGMASEPGTKVVHSDPADPNKPVTTTLTWRRGYDFTVVAQTPGIYRLSVNGVNVLTGEVYDYAGNGPSTGCQVKREDKGFCVPELQSVKDGETVAVTVTAQYATGPWLAELRSEWQDPSAQG